MESTTPKRGERNMGFVSLEQIDPAKWIAGVAVVTVDKQGNYATEFIAEAIDDLPDEGVQHDLGSMLATAWEIAAIGCPVPE